MIDRTDITGVVLAGGRGTRHGGADKGLLKLNGEPLAAIVADHLTAHCAQVLINCNRNLAEYAGLGFEVCEDARPDFAGPLAGIESALNRCATEWVVVMPCDTPALPTDILQLLLQTQQNGNFDIVYANAAGRSHYLCALIRRSLSPDLTRFLNAGERKVINWYQTQRFGEAVFDEEIRNLNDIEALNRLSGELERKNPTPKG